MPLPVALSRSLDAVAFALGAMFIAGMARLAFTLSTWPFRMLAAATAIFLAYRLVQIARSLWLNGWDPNHGVTKHLL
jgi:hypothetical protein